MDLYETFLIKKATDLFEDSFLSEISVRPAAARVKSKPSVAAAMDQQAKAGKQAQQSGVDFVKKQQADKVAQAQAAQTKAGQSYQQQTSAGAQGQSFKDKWAAMSPDEQAKMVPKYAQAISGWVKEDPSLKPAILAILKAGIAQK